MHPCHPLTNTRWYHSVLYFVCCWSSDSDNCLQCHIVSTWRETASTSWCDGGNNATQQSIIHPGKSKMESSLRIPCFYDPQNVNTRTAEKDPFWKICILLCQLNNQSKMMWMTGTHVSVDEQTIALKGWSSMKLQILYKKEGDRFQCDAICDHGYLQKHFFALYCIKALAHGVIWTLGQWLPPSIRQEEEKNAN